MKDKILLLSGILLISMAGHAQVFKINLNQAEPLSITIGNDTLICPLYPVSLGKDMTADGGYPEYIYMWDPVDGLDDPSSPNPVATISESMEYTLTVRDANNCEINESIYIYVDPCVGIDDMKILDEIAIYPNPSYGKITISGIGSISGKTSISLVNQIGVEIYREDIQSGVGLIEYDLHSMKIPGGVYFFRIIRGADVKVYKVQLI